MEFLPQIVALAGIHILAVMSPGPDFALIVKQALTRSRRTGVYSALGIALGIFVHVAYSLVGLGVIIAQSIVLFSIIKFAGAAYLIYVGYKALRAMPANTEEVESTSQNGALPDDSTTPWQAVRTGFLTNALNPKASIYFLSLFTQVIDVNTGLGIQLVYGIEMALITFLWFGAVAIGLSRPSIHAKFRRVQHHVERVMGAVLIALGVKIATASQE